MRTKCFELLFRTTAEADRGREFGSSKTSFHPPPPKWSSDLLLSVPRRYFCCGSPMLLVGMPVSLIRAFSDFKAFFILYFDWPPIKIYKKALKLEKARITVSCDLKIDIL